jgi:predicted nucleic acid-binding protein
MIFVDSNVPMYLIGAGHRHKTDAQRALERLISERERLVTDAEVLQEILHPRTIVLERPLLSARVAVHLAVMQAQGIERILSFDTGFDHIPGIERIRG